MVREAMEPRFESVSYTTVLFPTPRRDRRSPLRDSNRAHTVDCWNYHSTVENPS